MFHYLCRSSAANSSIAPSCSSSAAGCCQFGSLFSRSLRSHFLLFHKDKKRERERTLFSLFFRWMLECHSSFGRQHWHFGQIHYSSRSAQAFAPDSQKPTAAAPPSAQFVLCVSIGKRRCWTGSGFFFLPAARREMAVH